MKYKKMKNLSTSSAITEGMVLEAYIIPLPHDVV